MFEILWIASISKAMRKRFAKRLWRREKQISNILNRWNENTFAHKGLKFSSGYRGTWIELDVNVITNTNVNVIANTNVNVIKNKKVADFRSPKDFSLKRHLEPIPEH